MKLCTHFSLIFLTTRKFAIACVRLILRKVWVDGFTGPQRKVDVRYEFGLKVVLKSLGYKWVFLQPFLIEFPSNNKFCYYFCQIDIVDRFNEPQREIDVRYEFHFIPISKVLEWR